VVATAALTPGSVVMRERGLAVLADTVAAGAGICPVCFGLHAPDANGGRCLDTQVGGPCCGWFPLPLAAPQLRGSHRDEPQG